MRSVLSSVMSLCKGIGSNDDGSHTMGSGRSPLDMVVPVSSAEKSLMYRHEVPHISCKFEYLMRCLVTSELAQVILSQPCLFFCHSATDFKY